MNAGLRLLERPNLPEYASSKGQLDIQRCCQMSPLSRVYPQFSLLVEAPEVGARIT